MLQAPPQPIFENATSLEALGMRGGVALFCRSKVLGLTLRALAKTGIWGGLLFACSLC